MSASLTTFCPGWASRLAIGTLWLSALGAAMSGRALLPALPFSAFVAALGGEASRSLAALDPHPGGRAGRTASRFARHWLALLSLVAALAGAARSLAGTLDALSGGRARHWLFGELPEHSPAPEPWPDPLAVAALTVLCLMFMCGLENNSTFTILLVSSVVSGVVFFIAVGSLGANLKTWQEQSLLPEGWNGLIASAACCTYAFPATLPPTGSLSKRAQSLGLLLLPLLCMVAITTIYGMLVPYREFSESAVPLVQVFESHKPGWAGPAMASFSVVALALAMSELLPHAVALLVLMASSDWKLITRVLTYESSTTGSQVLAVFSAGSISAMLAFACPMAHLVRLTCAGQVLLWLLEAVLLLHLRCQPEMHIEDPTDVRYKRLPGATAAGARAGAGPARPSRGARLAAGLWCLPRSVRQQGPPDLTKMSKGGPSEERECLLLDEYAAIRPGAAETDLSEQLSEISDHGQSSSEGESSTDIDAVVKEYKDRITVVSSVPESGGGCLGLPSAGSGRRATAGAATVALAGLIVSLGATFGQPFIAYAAFPVVVAGTLVCWWQPARPGAPGAPRASLCCLCCSLMAVPLLLDAWPSLLLFLAAGVVMFVRRSTLCGAVPKRSSRPPPLLGSRSARITHLDTVYIASMSGWFIFCVTSAYVLLIGLLSHKKSHIRQGTVPLFCWNDKRILDFKAQQ